MLILPPFLFISRWIVQNCTIQRLIKRNGGSIFSLMTSWQLLLIIHQFSTASYKDALPEILEVLRAACLTHKLPLAQTWVTCAQQGKRGSRHSDENYRYCISTIDEACFVNEAETRGFHETCSEHHLLRGEGVAGKAFTTNQPCFLPDIGS
jgi:hypothetical protein